MNKARKEYIKSCEISDLVTVKLGGYEQKILIEGYKKGSPVLLILHGGPGFPVPFCVGARGLFPQMTRTFTCVYWDQLGCGINDRKLDDGFSVATFASMTEELVRYLKGRFPQEKLYLWGISWGSVLSLETARSLPDLVDGVFAAGQVLLPPLLSEEFFAAVERSAAPEKVKQKLRNLRSGKKPNEQEILLVSKVARKYTNAYGGKGNRGAKNPMKEIFASRDYRFRDKLACFRNGYRFNRSLLRELSEIDLREKFFEITVPYTVFGGEEDLVTPVRAVSDFFASANRSNLRCVVLPDEGHIPSKKITAEIFAEITRAAGV